MVSLTPGPFSCFATRNSLTESLHCFCAFHPNNSVKTCVNLVSQTRRNGRSGLGFLEVNQKKKGCFCSSCGVFFRRCTKGEMCWDSEGIKNLEAEILEFMNNSDKPGLFPTKEDLIRAGRSDLVNGILNHGGWLTMGWDMDEEEEEGTNEKRVQIDCSQDGNGAWNTVNLDGALSISSPSLPSASGSSLEEDDGCESGIEGILTRLEKERNLSLGLSLRDKGKNNGAMNNICQNDPLSVSSMNMVNEFRGITDPESNSSRSFSEDEENMFLEGKSPSGTRGLSSSTKPETWRTWSMKRAGISNVDFEAAEISPGSLSSSKEYKNEGSSESMDREDRYKSHSGEINKTHMKSRLQHLQAELSSVLHSLRSHTDEAVISKDSEEHSGNLETLFDAWEFQENEIMNAQDKLRSTRAKLAVLEGKMAMAIVDAQRITREKQKRIDHARRALQLLRSVCIIWPNSASEVLLSGSFDGWSTQRKMEKSKNGVFSLSLKLYPGKYEIKFIVDGQWKVDPLRPIVNYDGHENNLLIIT